MKRIATFLVLSFIAVGAFSQALTGVPWIAWAAEPDYPDVTGYAENPYENPLVVIPMAPPGVSIDMIVSPQVFDLAWSFLGDSMAISNLTSNGVAGDLFDLGEAATFGAAWKGMHDGTNLYVMIKYWDTNAQAMAGTRTFEVMAQPTSYKRHEPTFLAAADSGDLQVAYENMAYARYIELGGGKAAFADGNVTAYEASTGSSPDKKAWLPFVTSGWGNNENGLLALASANHYWDETDGVIRAILIMSFDGALAYPADPMDMAGDQIALKVGDTIAFDIKSNSTISVTDPAGDGQVQYFWAADRNNGYGSNYYSGHLVMAPKPAEPGEVALVGVPWVAWANEPDYPDMTGYAENPYDNPKVDILQAPESWSYDGITDAASFDATWDILGEPMGVSKLTSNGVAGDIYDLDDAATFGSQWKGVHDGSAFYVFLKYWDTNAQAMADSRTYEIMAQPTSPVRHEYTFTAAADSGDLQVAYENMAYARYIELGGGKAAFADGNVTAYEASTGTSPDKKAWLPFVTSGWGNNENGLLALASANHFWDVAEDGLIRAVMVMTLDGALAYPALPEELDGDYIPFNVGETFAFDVKSNSTISVTDPAGDGQIQYFWAADRNNGYGSNYYSGHLTLKEERIVIEGIDNPSISSVKVYVYNNQLQVRGVESVNLNIYSITGSLVRSARNVSGTLDISDLIDGVYLVKLEGIPVGYKVVK